MRHLPRAVLFPAVFLAVTASRADDLFSITAVGNGTNTVTATGSSVIDLSEDAIETSNDFSLLSGQNVVATLDYAGVADTARYTINAAGTTATLEFPITGFSRNFAGTDADDLADQIEDFIQDEGSSEYAKVLEAINQQSLVAVLDGNPFATTALAARHTFDTYALGVTGPMWANPQRYESDADDAGFVTWFEVSPRFAGIDADNFDGGSVGVDVAGGFQFNRTVGVAAGITLNYIDYDGTEVFHSSAHFAVPINIIPLSDWDENGDDSYSNRFGWQVTPFVVNGVGGSVDAAAGGAFFGGGIASNVHLGFHDRAVLNWGTQIAAYDGYDVTYDDYEFETDLTQQLFSTGLLVTVFLDQPDGNLFIEGGATYHAFLDDAAVDYWVSPEIGVGWRFTSDSRIRASYRPMFGNADYEAHTANLSLVWAF